MTAVSGSTTARAWASLLTITALVIVSAPAAAQDGGKASQTTLVERLRQLVSKAALGDGVGISVVNLRSGREVFSHHAHRGLNPASNMKLVTAAAALARLGPEFRTRTGLYGRQEGDGIVGGLYLKGFGDPLLTEGDLIGLAQSLARRGIKRVDELIVDATYFDDQVLPPAFEQQPDEVSPFRAAIAAVAVDRSAYSLRVSPGSAVGKPGRVHLSGSGYFEVHNATTTSAAGAPRIIAIQRANEGRLDLKLRGTVPAGISGVTYRRRVASPAHFAGHVMIDALRALRIAVPRRVRLGTRPSRAPLIVSHRSPPLSHVLASLGKKSDNFVAEMVLKTLGAEKAKRPGSSAGGVEVTLEFLKELGLPMSKISMVNGSGLFDGNRLAAAHLTKLLGAVYAMPDIRAEYVAHLAIGGADGTLKRRLTQLPAARIVHAKTGTLSDAIALSGYVLGPTPDRTFAFAFLANGVRGKHHATRGLADAIVTAIAEHLYAHK